MMRAARFSKIFKAILLVLFSLAIVNLFLAKNDFDILGLSVLLALCIGFLLYFIFDKPEFGVLSVLFSMAFMVSYSTEMSISFYAIYAIVPLASLLYFINHFPKSKVFWFLMLWMLLYYSIIIIARPYEESISSWLLRMSVLISVFIWSSLIKWNREKILFIAIAYGSYLAAWGIFERIISDMQRVSGPTGFATNYAVLSAVLWTICFVDFCVRKTGAMFIAFCTAGALFCVSLSGARLGLVGIFLGIVLGLLAWIFTKKEISVSRKFIWTASAFLISAGMVYFIWLMLPNDIYVVKNFNTLLSGKIDSSTLGRVFAWYAAWDAFSNNVLWGKGPDTFALIYSEFLDKFPLMKIPQRLPVAHNEILNILSENGLIGLLHVSVIVAVCLFCIINYIRKNNNDSIAIALLAAFFVLFSLMMFDSSPSRGSDPWILGVMASFGISQENKRVEIDAKSA